VRVKKISTHDRAATDCILRVGSLARTWSSEDAGRSAIDGRLSLGSVCAWPAAHGPSVSRVAQGVDLRWRDQRSQRSPSVKGVEPESVLYEQRSAQRTRNAKKGNWNPESSPHSLYITAVPSRGTKSRFRPDPQSRQAPREISPRPLRIRCRW